MVKHTRTIRRQIVDELFERVLPFCGIGAQNFVSREILPINLLCVRQTWNTQITLVISLRGVIFHSFDRIL